MKSMLMATALASGIALATAACSNKDSAADTTATDTTANAAVTPAAADTPVASSHAAQFLTEAMKGDNSEVKLGKLAQEKGESQGVKAFGKMLEDDHGKGKEQVEQVAKALNVATTDEITPEADAESAKLQGLSGDAFDKEFASYMVDDHKKDIDKFQQEAASSDPAQVTDLARQTLPTLKKHLQTAQSLQK
jgi:putative membrane protein